MSLFKHREIESLTFAGERVDFVSTNERISDRVSKISNEDDLLRKFVEVIDGDDVVWDVGACLGIHTFIAAAHLTEGEVISFEGMPVNRGVLLDNRSVNQLDNVFVVPDPLSNDSDTVEFAVRESFEAGFGRHGIATGEYDNLHTFSTQAVTGTELVVAGDAPTPNVVKIDVEGAEGLVIDGMLEVLSTDACQHAFVELHAPNPVQPSHEDFGYTREEIIELLEQCGFTVNTMGVDYMLHCQKEQPDEDVVVSDGVGNGDVFSDGVSVRVIQSDIAECEADALVASTGTSLRMGSGVAGALRDAGGKELYEESIRSGPIRVGEAVATTAGDLAADVVVHAASMPHYGDGKSTPESVERAVLSALRVADSEGCESVVVPAVGCGLGGVSLPTGVQRIVHAMNEFRPENIRDIRVIAYSDDERKTIERIISTTT